MLCEAAACYVRRQQPSTGSMRQQQKRAFLIRYQQDQEQATREVNLQYRFLFLFVVCFLFLFVVERFG